MRTIHKSCEDLGFIRNSKKETMVCNAIIKCLLDEMERGGHGMLMGTPTPVCVSYHPKYNRVLIDDNLKVANIMASTCNSFDIIIGDAVDKNKAKNKLEFWRRLSSVRTAKIKTMALNGSSYADVIEKAVKKYEFVKVVLLHSGIWPGCKISERKYGFDVDFKTPSELLTRKYPNLHILAMTMANHVGFNVRHLHNGTETILKLTKKNEA